MTRSIKDDNLPLKLFLTKRSDDGAGEGVDDGHGEDEEHPGVLHSKLELVKDGPSYAGNLCLGPRQAKAYDVEEELGEPDQLQRSANEGRGDDVVNEECAIVGQEHALPAVRAVVCHGVGNPFHKGLRTVGGTDRRTI